MNQVCSLGGGVASTTLFLMSLHGEIENPCSHAVFADTGAELETTHKTIHQLTEYAKDFGVPVHIVKSHLGVITENALKPDSKVGDIPFYTTNKDGNKTQLQKYCTNEFKTYPIWKWFRQEFGATYKNPITYWLGYTVNEIHRMKPAKVKYVVRRYPLIEYRVRRSDCYRYLEKYGFTQTSASACWCCPYRRDTEYGIMTEGEYQKAVDFEHAANQRGMITGEQTSELRIHRSLILLSEKPYLNDEQTTFDDVDDLCDGGSCFT